MTLVQFQVFVAVVEARSFTKAAESLNMTQSAVSQTIHTLESELGVTLLNRNRNGVTPTHIGERMLAHVREILFQARCMTEEAKAAQGLELGTLRLGSTSTMSAQLLPGIMGEFNRRFPGVQVVLFEGTHREVLRWIEESIVDVAFLSVNHGPFQLDVIPLIRDRLLVCLPPHHPWAERSEVPLTEVAAHPLILSKADTEGFLQPLFQEHNVTPTIQYEVLDPTTILAMVQESIGMALLPAMAVPKGNHDVPFVPISGAAREIGLCVRSLHAVTPVIAEFLLHAEQYVKEHFGTV